MLSAVRVAGQQQDASGGGDDEQQADQGLLDVGPAPLAEGQQRRCAQCGEAGGELRRETTPQFVQMNKARDNDTQGGNLGHREVDEDDAAPQYRNAQGHVGGEHHQPGSEGRQQQGGIGRRRAHRARLTAGP